MIDPYQSPKSQINAIGHSNAYASLKKAYEGRKLHHALLLAGPKGIGKATLAWQLIKALFSENWEVGSVEQSSPDLELIKSGGHPDLFVLETGDGKKISAQDVRELNSFVSKTPIYAKRKVVLIDSLDDLNHFGLNALLKSLEEPAGEVYFILICHEVGKLLPTVRSRCYLVSLSPLGREDMENFEGFSSLDFSQKGLVAGRPGLLVHFLKKEEENIAWGPIVEFFKTGLLEKNISVGQIKSLAEKMKTSSWARYSMTQFILQAVRVASGLPSNVLEQNEIDFIKRKSAKSWVKIWERWQVLERETVRLSLGWNESILVLANFLQQKNV